MTPTTTRSTTGVTCCRSCAPKSLGATRPRWPREKGDSGMSRKIKLGAILTGAGGPGHHFRWLDPEIPGDASIDVHWYIEHARQAQAALFDLVFIVDSQFITA